MRRDSWIFLFCLGLMSGTSATAQEPKVSFKEDKDAIEFYLDGKLATRYLFGAGLAKPLFWPVLAPGEVPVTRAWPLDKTIKGESEDHPHQKSFWFCHGDVIPEGLALKEKIKGVAGADFWSEAKGHGVIRQIKFEVQKGAGNEVVLRTVNDWTHGEITILKEERTTTFRPAPGGWILLMESQLQAVKSPVIFGDTKEGAFALRVNDQMRADKKGNGQIRLPGGKMGEKDCWGQRAPWCDYAGNVNGKMVGVTVFASSANPSPTCWHVRGYGLIAANPFGRKSFPGSRAGGDLIHLPQGKTVEFRYAAHIYAGERTEADIEKMAEKVWK